MIPVVTKSIHRSTPKAGAYQKAVDRGDGFDDSLTIQHLSKMQTVGKWVRSP